MTVNEILTTVSLLASISSIVFALLAFKRNERHDHRSEGKSEGQILSDTGYIKACVDRMEKNFTGVDERYRDIVQRLAKVEEHVAHDEKMMNNIVTKGG